MPPLKRNRKKRTVYLGAADEEALRAVRSHALLKTKAAGIRYAIRELARQIGRGPDRPAVVALIEAVESLPLLSDRDARKLGGLCAAARREIK